MLVPGTLTGDHDGDGYQGVDSGGGGYVALRTALLPTFHTHCGASAADEVGLGGGSQGGRLSSV